MEIPDHIDALRRQGGLLAATAERAGLDAPAPPCPTWRVKDLLRPRRIHPPVGCPAHH